MDNEFKMRIASKIYNYYYELAIKEFDIQTSNYLAKIPADYVYYSLNETCYINEKCCLEYCNDVLDDDFNRLDPDIKRKCYEKAFGINAAGLNPSEINLKLKSKRRIFKNKYNDAVKQIRTKINENDLIKTMSGLSIKIPLKRKIDDLDNVLKNISLN